MRSFAHLYAIHPSMSPLPLHATISTPINTAATAIAAMAITIVQVVLREFEELGGVGLGVGAGKGRGEGCCVELGGSGRGRMGLEGGGAGVKVMVRVFCRTIPLREIVTVRVVAWSDL